jgi:hypothetical protein
MTAYYATGGTIQVQPVKFESPAETILFVSGTEACRHFNKAKGTIFGAIRTAESRPTYRWNGYTITKISLEEYTRHTQDTCSDSCPHDSDFLTKVIVSVDGTETSQD